MKSVLVRFQEYEEKASSAEKLIVRFILEHPKEASSYSIHQLAGAAFSSSSTIVRLCKKTGFSGYKEFQKALIAEMTIREQSEDAKSEEIQREDKLEDLIAKITYKNIVSLEKTSKLLDEDVEAVCGFVGSVPECLFFRHGIFSFGSSGRIYEIFKDR
jgi:DNA-binding MurR/RpiR family transcriptional regulator